MTIKKNKKIIIPLFLLIVWVLFAQSCMRFTISDKKAVDDFNNAGVALTMDDMRVNGRNIHYAKTGKDSLPTLFFIHGSPGSWNGFDAYMKDKELLQFFRMVSVDRPGFGKSNLGESADLATQTKLLLPLVLKMQNGKPLYLIGHSLGGPLVLEIAIECPALISGITVLAGSVDPAEEKPERWRTIFMNNPLKFLIPGALRPSNEELWYLKKDLARLKNQYKQIKCPVKIIHGNKDVLVPYANMQFLKKELGNMVTDTITINEANHFIPWSHYAIIKKSLLTYVK